MCVFVCLPCRPPLQFLLLISTAVIIPLKLAFDSFTTNVELLWWGHFVDSMLILDVVVNFFVSFYDGTGNLVERYPLIWGNYLKGTMAKLAAWAALRFRSRLRSRVK